MARPEPAYLGGKIITGYLGTEASLARWMPEHTELALLQMDHGDVDQRPCVVIAANEDKGSKTAGKRVIMITAVLRFSLTPQGEGAATDAESLRGKMTRAQGSEVIEAIEARLRDRSALAAYLATLDEEEREGWTIMKYLPLPGGEIARDPKLPEIDLTANLKVILSWPENNAV